MHTIATLFSGGMDGFATAAAERTDQYRLIWQCENDAFRAGMLRTAFGVKVYDDILTLLAHNPEPPDVIAITSPCQDLSVAGKQTGIFGEQSKLLFDALKIIDVLRPKYFIVENSTNITNTGLGHVLAAISEMGGYGCEWQCISAAALGAQVMRDRFLLVASRADKIRRQGLLHQPREISSVSTESLPKKNITSMLVSRVKQTRNATGVLEPDGLCAIPRRYHFEPKPNE